jgi:hypothetical protein
MTGHRTSLTTLFVSVVGLSAIGAQAPRPANVPFYTWVREDTFAGFINDDLSRFEQGVQKAREYLGEDPSRADATNWLAATDVYRAVRAFKAGDAAGGDRLLTEAFKAMDEVAARAPKDVGVRATAGGTLIYFASQLPERHYRPALERARAHYAMLYELQSPLLPQLPLHIKGELLAGVAETELRVGDKARATALLNQIVAELPKTGYAKTAEAWLKTPDSVPRESRLACQSCHEPGRLQAWAARQK